MNFERQIELIQAAAGDPKKLALAVLEISLAGQPPELRRVVEAAAVPRWFDAAILERMLDDDLRPDAARWLERLLELDCMEKFEARGGWNVHETTRLAIRQQLHVLKPARLVELAARAMAVFSASGTENQIERAYHRILVDPSGCYEALCELNFASQARPADALALAQAVAEYPVEEFWPSLTRAWSLIMRAANLEPYRSLQTTIGDLLAAERLFQEGNHLAGLAWCQDWLGTKCEERGGFNDADQAWRYYRHSLELREQLLAANPESAQAARDVSVSLIRLGDFLTTRGKAGDAEQALAHYQRRLEISERLLAANPESVQAARDVAVSFNHLGDFLASRSKAGDAEQALAHYQRDLEISERLLGTNPESAQAERDVSFSLEQMGDFLTNRGQVGDVEQALAHYQRSLEIRERLFEANPESAQAARDVSFSLERLGDFLTRRGKAGDADQALAHYQRGLEIRERLLGANPESAQAARDVSLSLNKLGGFLTSRGKAGDADQALAHYQRGLEIRERLLGANPESAQAARDVSFSLERLGDFLTRRGKAGDADQALAHYQRSLEITERLLGANPESAQAARDVSVSLNKLADFLTRRGKAGDAELALAHYQRCLVINERLLGVNPESAQAARDVSVSLSKLADFLTWRVKAVDTDQALAHYQRSLEIDERLLEANPESAQAARDVAVSLDKLGDFRTRRGKAGDAAKALAHYQRSVEIRERLLGANPESVQAARDVVCSLERVANMQAQHGEHGAALANQQRALTLARQLWANTKSYEMGSTLAISLFNTGWRAGRAGYKESGRTHFAEAYALLREFNEAGVTLDPQMQGIYRQLVGMFPEPPGAG